MGKKTPFYTSILLLCLFFVYCGKDDGPDKPDIPATDPPTITSVSPGQGAEGTPVTLTGTNLAKTGSETTVSFAGTAATVNSAITTSIQTTVPAGAETGKITVTVGTQTATSPEVFTVVEAEPVAPILSGFTPAQGTIGSEVTITGNHFGNDIDEITVVFNESEADAIINSASNTELVVQVPVETTIGPITVMVGGQTVISEENFTPLRPWQKIDFPGEGRTGGVMLSVGNKIYTGLGQNNIQGFSDWWEYDTTANTWTQRAPFLGGIRQSVISFVIGAKIYIGAGRDDGFITAYDDFYEYNTTNNQWSQLNNIGAYEQVWQSSTSFSINGIGYAYGGMNQYGDIYDMFTSYDPEWDSWLEATPIDNTGRIGATSFVIGNMGYVSMGSQILGQPFLKDLWEYDPEENIWTEKAPFPAEDGRISPISFVIGEKAFIGMGSNVDNVSYSDLWGYNPSDDSWSVKAPFGNNEVDSRSGLKATSVNGKGYVGFGKVGTGADASYPADIWIYDPELEQ